MNLGAIGRRRKREPLLQYLSTECPPVHRRRRGLLVSSAVWPHVLVEGVHQLARAHVWEAKTRSPSLSPRSMSPRSLFFLPSPWLQQSARLRPFPLLRAPSSGSTSCSCISLSSFRVWHAASPATTAAAARPAAVAVTACHRRSRPGRRGPSPLHPPPSASTREPGKSGAPLLLLYPLPEPLPVELLGFWPPRAMCAWSRFAPPRVARPPRAIAGRAEALRGSVQGRACRGPAARRRTLAPPTESSRPATSSAFYVEEEEGARGENREEGKGLNAKS
jgi:hypothetical protein